jgi:hypothetical protein
MKSVFFALLLSLLAAMTIASCSKSPTKAPGNPNDTTGTGTGTVTPPVTGTTDVYTCGGVSATASQLPTACYWKNGVEVDLFSDEIGAFANAIAVSDTNVYVVGVVDTSACYWVNGKLYNVGRGFNTQAMGVKAIHDTVYILVGTVYGAPADPPGIVVPGFVLILYPNGGSSEMDQVANYGHPVLGGIDVAAGQVYTAGASLYTDRFLGGQPVYEQQPVYWKNGEVQDKLPYPAPYALMEGIASAISVSGTDVYTAGSEFSSQDSGGYHDLTPQPVYWKNNTAVELDAPLAIGQATGIAVSGTDVYVLGEEYSGGQYEPCFWKNGTVNWLGRVGFTGYANAIALSGSDVYTAGYGMINPDPNNSGVTADVAAQWKNGDVTLLAPKAYSSAAYGICVVTH